MQRIKLNEYQGSVEMSAYDYVTVVKDDANDLPDGVCRGLLVGVEGTLTLVAPDGREVVDV
jgi:hypothetical protein